ncbi:MAG: multiubiquitin domain-containing protein [Candidatus Reddybacter sp.]
MNANDNAPGQQKAKHIFINGRPTPYKDDTISYSEVAALANPDGASEDILFSVKYTGPNIADGSLANGGSIEVVNGMKFDVSRTNRS